MPYDMQTLMRGLSTHVYCVEIVDAIDSTRVSLLVDYPSRLSLWQGYTRTIESVIPALLSNYGYDANDIDLHVNVTCIGWIFPCSTAYDGSGCYFAPCQEFYNDCI